MSATSAGSPLSFHRYRRDHQLRLFFSAAQRSAGGKPTWLRTGSTDLVGILAILDEALHHARETLRERSMEWPEDHADDSDRKLEKFLVEIGDWFRLMEHLVAGGEDPRPALRPLLESRMRLGQQLFHASRHPMGPAFARP